MVQHQFCMLSRSIKPDETQYPLQAKTPCGRDDPGLSEALGNQEPTLEDQDAEMVDEKMKLQEKIFNCLLPMPFTMKHGYHS